MSNNQRLELTWIGKGEEIKAEPRILLYDKDKSYGDQSEPNMLIHGDNLLALKALEQEFIGQVKCIYIDPPYNTGNAFEKYDDNLEHSIWLNLMEARFKLLHSLLRSDGFIFVNLDEQEHAYAKVLLDGVFGRRNFIGDIIWQKRKGGGNDSRYIALDHDYILLYAKDASKEVHPIKWRTAQSDEYLKRYKEQESDGRRYYWDTVARDGLQSPIPVSVICPDGSTLSINSQLGQETVNKGLADGTVRLTKSKNGWTLHHKVYMGRGQVQRSILNDIGTNKDAGDEMEYLFGDKKAFPYPKPESLISRILELGTNPGDLVLDSFLGSGTTAAVAHKMGRRYIGIELGEHCYTHCKPRLERIVDGTDQGGISKSVNWQGGGGFRFFELAPSLLKEDVFGNMIVDKEHYNAEMLTAAVAKINGYRYNPDPNVFWKHGQSTENSYIFVTTQFLTTKYLDALAKDLQGEENLLICCPAFDIGLDKRYDNVVVRKIPKSILEKCEYGKQDYNLNIVDVSEFEEDECDE